MSLERILGLSGACALALFGIVFIAELSSRADMAFRQQAAAEKTGTALAQQLAVDKTPTHLVIHLDRGVLPDCLGAGWSEVKAQPGMGVASVARMATLHLVGSPPKADMVALTVEPVFVHGDPSQRVRVSTRRRRLGEWLLTRPGTQILRFATPPEAHSGQGDLELELEFPDAGALRPENAASKFVQQVAIRLDQVEVVAAGEGARL
jgi:hypothetical protein